MAEAFISVDRVGLDCPICLDKLDRPRSLPCLHTFCTNCLREHVQITYKARAGYTFPCPVCRTQTRPIKPFTDTNVWAEQFPINYWMQSILEETRTNTHSDFVCCDIHKDLRINLFCQDHNVVLCPTCVAMNHRRCDTILEIEKFLPDFPVTSEIEKLTIAMTERVKKVNDDERHTQDKLNELNIERQQIEVAVDSRKEEFISRIEDMHRNFKDDLVKMFNEITSDIDDDLKGIKNNKYTTAKLKEQLASLDTDISPNIAFITLNQISSYLKEVNFESKRDPNMKDCTVIYDRPGASDNIKTLTCFGELRFCPRNEISASGEHTNSTRLVPEQSNKYEYNIVESDPDSEKFIDITSSYNQVNYSIKSSSVAICSDGSTVTAKIVALNSDTSLYNSRMVDTRMPRDDDRPSWISSMCRAGNNVHILCDQNSSSIKLLYDSKPVFELNRKTKPWGVCSLSTSKIAVTFPEENCIHIYETSYNKTALRVFGTPSVLNQTLKLQKVITTNGKSCYGIACLEDLMFVACESSIHVYDPTGSLLNSVSGCDTNLDGFIRVMDVAINPFRRSCFISDEGCDKVYSFDVVDFSVNKSPKFIYRNSMLKSPQGLDFDTHGRIYICGFVSRNIHLITVQGQLVKIITTLAQPWTISVDSTHSKLYISFFPDSPKGVNMFMCKMLPISILALPKATTQNMQVKGQ